MGQRLDPDTFVGMVAPVAQEICGRYGIYASVCIAQAAIESTWNADTVGEYNLFGRKASEGDIAAGRSEKHWTWEMLGPDAYTEDDEHIWKGSYWSILADFKTYQSLQEAVEDYCILITQDEKYTGVLANVGDLHAYVYALAGDGVNKGIYATNENYGPEILVTIRANELRKYDIIAGERNEDD